MGCPALLSKLLGCSHIVLALVLVVAVAWENSTYSSHRDGGSGSGSSGNSKLNGGGGGGGGGGSNSTFTLHTAPRPQHLRPGVQVQSCHCSGRLRVSGCQCSNLKVAASESLGASSCQWSETATGCGNLNFGSPAGPRARAVDPPGTFCPSQVGWATSGLLLVLVVLPSKLRVSLRLDSKPMPGPAERLGSLS